MTTSTLSLIVESGAVVLFASLNRSFYALLLRKQKAWEAALGLPLHILHHLTGVAALPVAAALFLREGKLWRRRDGNVPDA